MKKYLVPVTVLAIVVVSIASKAQTVVPNAGLEAWHTVGSYEDPDSWNTLNPITSFGGHESVTKSTDALDGLYAAKLEAFKVFGLTVPGGMGTGVLDFVSQNFSGGFPLSGPDPKEIIGYYKYTPVGGDSCLVGAALFKWNTVTNQRDTIAIGYFTGGPAANYTFFSAPFTYLITGTPPDSAIVVVSTAKDILNAQEGSVMFADDIDFTATVGVYEIPQQMIQVFPNPGNQTVQVTIPQGMQVSTLLITGVDGKKVSEIPNTSLASEININTSALTDGIYMLYLKSEKGKIVSTGKFTVKH